MRKRKGGHEREVGVDNQYIFLLHDSVIINRISNLSSYIYQMLTACLGREIYTREYYSAIKRMKNVIAGTHMDLDIVLLSKISQTDKENII